MPITVYYHNNTENKCIIRPTPLISINTNILKNGAGESFGVTYQIVLNGTIIANEGLPFARMENLLLSSSNHEESLFPFFNLEKHEVKSNLVGPYRSFYNKSLHDRPPTQLVTDKAASNAIFSKQKALRALFAIDGQRVEIHDWVGLDSAAEDDNRPVLVFFPRITNISFSEGIYVDVCDYTITMEADTILKLNREVSGTQSPFSEFYVQSSDVFYRAPSGVQSVSGVYGLDPDDFQADPNRLDRFELLTEDDFNSLNLFHISDYSESWSIEADENFGENLGPVPHFDPPTSEQPVTRDLIVPKTYVLTHNISAVGKTHYRPKSDSNGGVIKSSAFEEARNFVQSKLSDHDSYANDYSLSGVTSAYPNVPLLFGSGSLNLLRHYTGFNHSRNEEINVSEGSYAVKDTWLISSGTSYENYSTSITTDNQNPFVNVSVQGNIKGLTSLSPSSIYYGGLYEDHKLLEKGKKDPRFLISPYTNALSRWYQISRSGTFGYHSDLYRRVNSAVAVELNSQPLEISLGMNEYTGEINYSLSFDNRPANIISGVLFEDISVNDTYPGDVFSVIPIIGRKTGPILQYNGSRSEYARNLSISLILDHTKIPYDSDRKMLLRKPSVINPTAQQLEDLIYELSPAQEPGVKKFFHNAPTESWNPKTGQYTLDISWVYELDK